MSRSSREGGKRGEKFLVESGRCKQWIRGDSLGLHDRKWSHRTF